MHPNLAHVLSKKSILVLILLIFISLAARWNTLYAPLERDEGEYAYAAWAINQGAHFYEDFFIQKPPGIIYIYYFSQKVFGQNEYGYRLLAILAVAMSAFFIFLTITKSTLVGVLCGILYIITVSLPVPLFWNGVANTEIFLNAPLTLALLILSKHRFYWYRLMVLLLALASAFWIKPIVAVVALAIISMYIYRHFWEIKGRDLRYSLGLFFLFFVLITLPITVQNSWKFLWESTVQYNVAYAKNYGVAQFLGNMKYFWKVFSPLWILVLSSIFWIRKNRIISWLWMLWILGLLSLYAAPIPRYYLMLFPIAILLCGEMLGILKSDLNPLKISVFMILMTWIIWPWKFNYLLNSDDYMRTMYPREDFSETRNLAISLNASLLKNETLYVIGSEPQIYYYTHKMSPTRFITKYPFMLDTKYNLMYQLEELNILKKNLPDWIVWSKNPQSFLNTEKTPLLYEQEISNIIAQHYIYMPMKSGQFSVYRKKMNELQNQNI